MDRKLSTAAIALLLFLFLAVAQAAGPFGTRTATAPAVPPPTPKIMVQPCVNTRGGFGTLAPCTASAAASTTSSITTSDSTVFRYMPGSNPATPPAGQTTITVSLFTQNVAVTLNNACVCSGAAGTGSWNCATGSTVQRITCGGSNSCSLGTSTPVTLDPVTYAWNASATVGMFFSFDTSANASGWNKAGVSASTAPINYSTTNGAAGGTNSPVTSFNTFHKASVTEACAAANAKTGSYLNNGTNGIFMISKIVVQ